MPQETRDAGVETDLAGDIRDTGEPPVDETATQRDDPAYSRLKGKKKDGEPFEPVAFFYGTSSSHPVANEPDATSQGAKTAREPLGVMVLEISAPTESTPTPPAGGGADPNYEVHAADLNTQANRMEKGFYEERKEQKYYGNKTFAEILRENRETKGVQVSKESGQREKERGGMKDLTMFWSSH
ncbi:hypothetical protein LWI29_022035 [Acer saccharum]|uniref:Uncharacterized protein n=1 Tax=Acer saccharum TaxID=4024 RepID=A0AA39SYC5_ACESA|nr:hypothetical protein LWI29_022035 [Acer saccharum]